MAWSCHLISPNHTNNKWLYHCKSLYLWKFLQSDRERQRHSLQLKTSASETWVIYCGLTRTLFLFSNVRFRETTHRKNCKAQCYSLFLSHLPVCTWSRLLLDQHQSFRYTCTLTNTQFCQSHSRHKLSTLKYQHQWNIYLKNSTLWWTETAVTLNKLEGVWIDTEATAGVVHWARYQV